MDLQKLKERYPILVSYMEKQHYSWQYVKHVKNEARWILRESENYGWKTYDDVYQACVKKYSNKYTLLYKRKMLRVIEQFVSENILPDGSLHVHKASYYDNLCDEYKRFINVYRGVIKSKQDNPLHYHKSCECSACSFLFRLQEQGIYSLEDVTEEDVMNIFTSNKKLIGSYHFRMENVFVLKHCESFYSPGLCKRIISYFPDTRIKRKNIQYLSKFEIEKIRDVLNENSMLSFQERAIGLLAFYTGLRSCDIAALRFSDIDWEKDIISITQQKTGTPLVLPLRAIVGNAIYDYIMKERPKSKEDFIFLKVNVPHKRLHSSNLYAISAKIMKAAGIRNESGTSKGLHLFRHHLATTLLENGIETPIIEKTLGHYSASSLETYLKADFKHLKECALSIDIYPIRKEVFNGI